MQFEYFFFLIRYLMSKISLANLSLCYPGSPAQPYPFNSAQLLHCTENQVVSPRLYIYVQDVIVIAIQVETHWCFQLILIKILIMLVICDAQIALCDIVWCSCSPLFLMLTKTLAEIFILQASQHINLLLHQCHKTDILKQRKHYM